MANKAPETSGLKQAAKDRAAEKEKQAKEAISKLNQEKKPITFASVSQEAGVSRNYLYKHPELRAQIERFRSTPQTRRPLQVSLESSQENVIAALRLKIRNMETQHKNEIALYKTELAKANHKIEHLTAKLIELS